MARINILVALALVCTVRGELSRLRPADLYVNAIGLTIVISGTLAATVLSYPMDDIGAAIRVAHNSYASSPPSDTEIVDAMLDLAVRSRNHGVLALEDAEEEVTVGFLFHRVGMLVDGYQKCEIRDILATEMHYSANAASSTNACSGTSARLAPAFGVAGSVVGLVAMLADVGDPDTILQSVPIALTSTSYGIVIRQPVSGIHGREHQPQDERGGVHPEADRRRRHRHCSEQNTVKLAKKLESFLTPAARPSNTRSLESSAAATVSCAAPAHPRWAHDSPE